VPPKSGFSCRSVITSQSRGQFGTSIVFVAQKLTLSSSVGFSFGAARSKIPVSRPKLWRTTCTSHRETSLGCHRLSTNEVMAWRLAGKHVLFKTWLQSSRSQPHVIGQTRAKNELASSNEKPSTRNLGIWKAWNKYRLSAIVYWKLWVCRVV